MSTIAAALKHMLAAGMTHDAIVAAVAEMEAGLARDPVAERKRERDRERMRAIRATSRDTSDNGDVAPTASRAHVEYTSLPSEEVITPYTLPSGANPPKPKRPAEGHRLPDDWLPAADYVAPDFGLTHEQHAGELAKFLDYWRSVPGAKGRKVDWDATWRNWMRRAAENLAKAGPHVRPHPSQRRTDREDNLTRALAGAEIASRGGR